MAAASIGPFSSAAFPPHFSAKIVPVQSSPKCCWRRPFASLPSSPPIAFKWPLSAACEHSSRIASNSNNNFCIYSDDIVSIRTVPQSAAGISNLDNENDHAASSAADCSHCVLLCVCPFVGPYQRQLLHFELRADRPSQLMPLRQSIGLSLLRQRRFVAVAPHNPTAAAMPSRRVLVLLNPFSGQQRAVHLWETEVEPLWREAGIQYTVKLTEGPEHAVQVAAELDLDSIGMLALGGGDGIVCEVINGLCLRPDSDRALRLPLLHLPMGTGNSLAASVAFMANEPFSSRGTFCRQMALMALHPRYRRLSLFRAEFSQNRAKMMFLSLSWGLLADIDLGSERFRCLGMIRLHLEAFIRIAQLPTVAHYCARLSYLPLDGGSSESRELERKLRFRVEVPRNAFGDGHFSGGEVAEEGTQSIGEEDEGTHFVMPSLNEPIPSHWISIEGEFCFVLLSALSHLGSDIPIVPSARLQDPVLCLSFVRWKNLRSRLHMARILLSINSSAHLDDPAFEIIAVKACRIQPAPGMGGFVALDGEPIQNGIGESFQVVATERSATVVGREERQREEGQS